MYKNRASQPRSKTTRYRRLITGQMPGGEIKTRHTPVEKAIVPKSDKDGLVNARLFYVKQFVRNRRYPAYDHSGDLNSHFIAL